MLTVMSSCYQLQEVQLQNYSSQDLDFERTRSWLEHEEGGGQPGGAGSEATVPGEAWHLSIVA